MQTVRSKKLSLIDKIMITTIIFTIVILSTEAKNNVLFIIVDDLRPSLGCYDYKNAYTPNIDKLASKSFVFNNVYAQQALCAPSRNSLLTSRRPDSLHLYDFYNYWRTFAGNFTTLPQHFKQNGYHTYSVGKVFHPGISSNSTDDFPLSWSQVPFHPKSGKYKDAKVCLDESGNLAKNLICPVIVESQPMGTLPDIESAGESLRFLKSVNETFFLAVGFHKPHIPLKFPREFLKYHPIENVKLPKNRWKSYSLPNVAWNPWNDVRKRDDMKKLNITFPYGPISDDVIKRIIQSYDAAVSYTDSLVGEVLKIVDNNTIIVLTSDHGWSMGEHGEFSKYSNFQVATRVPLIIHIPGSNENKIVNDLIELVDLFPTLVDLTNVSKPIKTCLRNGLNSDLCTEGRSFANLLKGGTGLNKNAIFTQYPRPGTFPTLHPDSDKPRLKDIKIMGYSMKTLRYRYSEWVEFDNKNFSINWNNLYGKELYDHLIDPNENMNIVDKPELQYIVRLLQNKLHLGWRYA